MTDNTEDPCPFLDKMAATHSFREALSEGIGSGIFSDTKIILFSRKSRSRGVYGPKALYASSHVLRSIPHFEQRKSLAPTLRIT